MNETANSKVRFSLKTLLVLVMVAPVGLWLADRYFMDRARFEILETDLHVEEGYLSGAISFRCSRFNNNDNVEHSDTVLYIREFADTRLIDLKEGDEFFVRYRHRDFGFITRQNRFVVFMVGKLGLPREEVSNAKWLEMDGWVEVHVRGKESPLTEESGGPQ